MRIVLAGLALLALAGCVTREAAKPEAEERPAVVRPGSGPALARGQCYARDASGNIVFDAAGRPTTTGC